MIDSHCHVGFDELKENVDGYVARAQGQGIQLILTVACHEHQLTDLYDVLEKYPFIYGAFGIHPQENEQRVSLVRLKEIAQHPKIVGIGETGFDLFYEPDSFEHQKKNFEIHIQAALETNLPLIIHSRSADVQTIDLLRNFKESKGVIHCFSGSLDFARQALDLGFYISASGIITFKKSQELRDIFKTIPLDRLLIETDAPYLAPEPYRGRINESAYVSKVLDKLAEIKGVSPEKLEEITTQNFLNLFKKVRGES